jgi:heme a synthase
MHDTPKTSRAFTTYSWIFVGYLLFVILFGAWVRITGSGAGCGAHWPTCHGEIIPVDPDIKTIIEYTHRLTSGFLGILSLIWSAWAYRIFRRGSVFWATIVTLIFIIFESLIGAGIVLAELVADDDSKARAIIIAIHLVNTMMLTGAAALAAWWSTGRPLPRLSDGGKLNGLYLAAILGLVLTSMSGAITALGDTLFPVDPTVGEGLFARIREDLSPVNHFLVRLRIFHPVIAIGASAYLLVMGWLVRLRYPSQPPENWTWIMSGLVMVQIAIGFLNIALAAPGWLQLVHLLFAQLVWISLVLLIDTSLVHEANKSSKVG